MRYFILSLLSMAAMPSTAAAWEFTPGLPCLLTHGEQELDIELTHDPLAPLYTITLRRAQPWPDGQVFSIAFEGGVTISTNRQVISEGGRALTVSDRGFGNVIVGFATSARATARFGDVSETFSLNGAANPVRDFALCAPQPAV